jgi:hypothetical protein
MTTDEITKDPELRRRAGESLSDVRARLETKRLAQSDEVQFSKRLLVADVEELVAKATEDEKRRAVRAHDSSDEGGAEDAVAEVEKFIAQMSDAATEEAAKLATAADGKAEVIPSRDDWMADVRGGTWSKGSAIDAHGVEEPPETVGLDLGGEL